MGFNLKVLLHVLGILATAVVLAWCLVNTSYYATMLTLTLLLGFQIHGLLRYVHFTNRELSRFLSAVRYADFSQSFQNQRPSTSFRELGRAFDGVIERFRNERSNREEQAAWLQAFVQQMPIAVLSLEEDGRISVSNQAFRRLCGMRGTVDHLDQVKQSDARLGEYLQHLQPGREKSLKLTRNHQLQHLKLACTLLRSRGRQQKLISIQDIQGELEVRELEAWQNLIRVMTHEIMNSVTPIASLADTADQLVRDAGGRLAPRGDDTGDTRELLEDAAQAITTIANRSQGLLRFVQSYRSLTRLPAPEVRLFRVSELFQSVSNLMQEQASAGGVALQYRCTPQTLELRADPEQLEQALINLVRNALDAVAECKHPTVTLSGQLLDLGRVRISIRDNGTGIDPQHLDSIFVPFFTTKRGGSGVGMSIVRQIARLNGGNVGVESSPGAGTSILMTF